MFFLLFVFLLYSLIVVAALRVVVVGDAKNSRLEDVKNSYLHIYS